MTKESKKGSSADKAGTTPAKTEHFRRGGYRPTNGGYAGGESKGYKAANGQSLQKLPKAPEGGTGVTPPATNKAVTDKKG